MKKKELIKELELLKVQYKECNKQLSKLYLKYESLHEENELLRYAIKKLPYSEEEWDFNKYDSRLVVGYLQGCINYCNYLIERKGE